MMTGSGYATLTGLMLFVAILVLPGSFQETCAETMIEGGHSRQLIAQLTRSDPRLVPAARQQEQPVMPAIRSPGLAVTPGSETIEKQDSQADTKDAAPSRLDRRTTKEDAPAPAPTPKPLQQQPRPLEPSRSPEAITSPKQQEPSVVPALGKPHPGVTPDSETTDAQESRAGTTEPAPSRPDRGVIKQEATAPAALPARPLPAARPQAPAQTEPRPRILPGQSTSTATTPKPLQQQPRPIEPSRTPATGKPASVPQKVPSASTTQPWYEQSQPIFQQQAVEQPERQGISPPAASRPWYQQQLPVATDAPAAARQPHVSVPVERKEDALGGGRTGGVLSDMPPRSMPDKSMGPAGAAQQEPDTLTHGADPGARASGGGIWRANDGFFSGLGRSQESYGLGQSRQQAESVSDLNPWNDPDATQKGAERSRAMADLLDFASDASSATGVGTLGLSKILSIFSAAMNVVGDEQEARAEELRAEQESQEESQEGSSENAGEESDESSDREEDEDKSEEVAKDEEDEEEGETESESRPGDPDAWGSDEAPTSRTGLAGSPRTRSPVDDGRVGGEADEERESVHVTRPELDVEGQVTERAGQVGDRRERGPGFQIRLPEDRLGDPPGGGSAR